ncbi:MAG TPA: porin [Polyangiales bacterium]|nr:porin [Polyangiales bacterium]
MQRAAWIILASLGLSSAARAQSTPPSEPEAVPPAAPQEPPASEVPAAPASVPAPAVPPPPPAAEPPPPEAAEAEDDAKWPKLEFHARVMTGVEVEREHPKGNQPPEEETQAGLFLEQAVVEAEVLISKRLELELGFNLANATVRDAFVNYRVDDALQLRIGRFKRPFSRVELRSRGKLPFRDRGLFNSLLDDSGYVGRTLAGMVWGKPLPQLRYFVAGASPAPLGADIEGLDLVARVAYDPNQWLSIGVNGLHKWSERSADGEALRVSAVGADAKLDVGALSISLEVDAAQNPDPPPVADESASSRTPWALGVLGYGDYTWQLSKKWTIAVVGVLEWMDSDTEYEKDERIRAVAGLSWNFKKNALRIMPQVELTRPLGEADARGEVASETYYLLVSAEI